MTAFESQLPLDFFSPKTLEVKFSGLSLSSDAGLLLVRQAEEQLKLCQSMADCLSDNREQAKVKHSLIQLLSQRIYQIAAGYEDTNDSNYLRHDPIFKMVCDRIVKYQETKPATLTGIEKYLGSGLIKGVGPVTAKRIVKHFGLDTLEIIENQIDRLSEVPGIASKRIAMIQNTWEEQKSIKEVMVFLSGHGVSTTYAVKIYKQYGDDAIGIVTTNPYQLAIDIFGIGFLTADKIAVNVGVPRDSQFRYRTGILHVLNKASYWNVMPLW